MIELGQIYEVVIVLTEKTEKSLKALFDSGASRCFIKKEIIDEIGGRYTGWEPLIKVANGRMVKVKEVELKSIRVFDLERPFPRVYAIEGLPEDMLIGQDAMQELGVILEMREEKAVLKKSEQCAGYIYIMF